MLLLRSTLALALVACGATPVPIQPAAVPAHVVALPPPVATAVADPVSPLDPNIKRGTLPNGLTYYVVKHAKPEQRAALWLAVDAGAVLEDEDQRGLAHFVEHMAFNGTRRFPKQQIVDFIEKAGMRFGADVNAYTGFDQTVYQLTVPTDDAPVMMKGLDILRDWAGDITFDPVEVDKERGVVLEEWRLGRGADARISDKQFPIILAGSKYGERLPIGLPAVLKAAPRAALARFYKDWYQPQHMAVIAIGDFEPREVEAAIVARFGDLQATPDARPRIAVPVPHDHPTLITIETDKEMPTTSIAVYDKLEHRRETTKGDYRRLIVEALYHAMLNARFAELAEEPDAPFLYAGSGTGGFVRTSDTFNRFASAKQGRVEETLTVLFRELARVEQHGFLPSELARAVRAQLASFESSAAEWDKTPSPELADEVTRNFFEGEQMPGRVVELAYARELIPTITLAELDQLAKTWGGQAGRVVAIQGPQGQPGARLPTVDEVRALIAATATTAVAPWQDDGGDRPLMTTTPVAGEVVATTRDATSDITTWTLANGVRVRVKPTTFQNDEVMMTGYQRGGSSRVADQDYVQARFAADIVSASGVGELDAKALRKVLAGKQADAVVGLGELAASVWGRARPADLETMLQLAHLRLTAPRQDPRAFATWKAEQLEDLRNRALSPERMFFEQLEGVTSSNHPRRAPTTPEMIAKVDLAKALASYRERFADLGDFTFVIVGNLELAKLQPLVERYLGSLPSKGRKETWKDVGVTFPAGKITKRYTLGSEPKSFVELQMKAREPWTLDGARDAEILAMAVGIRLREVLREDLGGVYGVQLWASVTREPTPGRELGVFFGCAPENVDKLRAAVFAEFASVAKGGLGTDYLTKVTETLRRTRETDRKTNGWWLDQIRDAAYYGDDLGVQTDLDAMIARVTSANIQAAAKRFFDPRHYVLGVMMPATK